MMAELVGGFAVSHSSLMVTRPDLVSPALAKRCAAAYDHVRESIAALEPDTMIVLGTDHFNTFSYDVMPQWCVGRASFHEGCADNIPMFGIAGDPRLSADVLASLLLQGFEPSFSDSMRLDHSFFAPLHFLTPEMNVPIVPIFQNCVAAPFPTLSRSLAFGEALASAVASSGEKKRVVIIGSGGLSHWIGGPQHGRLNPDFDREFLERYTANDVEWLMSLSDRLEELAGNGGHELRNWLGVRGAFANGNARKIYYEPAHPWIVGVGVSALTVESR